MSTLFDVALRSAEPPDQEVAKARLGAGKVVRGVHRPKDRIGWYLAVERGDQPLESVLANRLVELVIFHAPILLGGVSSPRADCALGSGTGDRDNRPERTAASGIAAVAADVVRPHGEESRDCRSARRPRQHRAVSRRYANRFVCQRPNHRLARHLGIPGERWHCRTTHLLAG